MIEELEGLRIKLLEEARNPQPKIEITDREKEEALSILKSPDLIKLILKDIEALGYIGEETNKLVGYLCTISRFHELPLGVLIVSRSGAGKSALQGNVSQLVPPEALIRLTRLTGQSLFYMGKDNLSHKLLSVEEESGAQEALYSLRNLLSAQYLSTSSTTTDPKTGLMRTKLFETNGPCAVIISTTSAQAFFDYETRSRFIILTIDESCSQTERILSAQRLSTTLDGRVQQGNKKEIIKRHHTMQRLLKPIEVVNPYGKYLEYPTYRLQMRRDQKKYLSLIETITLLHQYQRPRKKWIREGKGGEEYIEAGLSDIELANRIAREVLVRSSDEMAPHTRKFLEDIDSMAEKKVRDFGEKSKYIFDRREIVKETSWSIWQSRQHLSELIELGYINVAAGKNGQRYAYQLAYNGELEKEIVLQLADIDELKRRYERDQGQGEN